jgi:predicted permease
VFHIIATIAPVFAIILLGLLLRRFEFLPEAFLKTANRLTYYVAIPAMMVRQIAQASFSGDLNFAAVAATLAPLIIVLALGFYLVRFMRFTHPAQAGTFVQCTFHANLGYIGLAVAYYYLGGTGLAQAGILAGFLIIFQNLLAVAVLGRSRFKGKARAALPYLFHEILLHPVILSVMTGMAISLSGITMPVILDRSLKILGDMALPLALLVIGASLSFTRLQEQMKPMFSIAALKLIVLPGLGLSLYRTAGLVRAEYIPGLILLASPPATIVYVMAVEMGGDPDLASAAISAGTLISAASFTFWLGLTS